MVKQNDEPPWHPHEAIAAELIRISASESDAHRVMDVHKWDRMRYKTPEKLAIYFWRKILKQLNTNG